MKDTAVFLMNKEKDKIISFGPNEEIMLAGISPYMSLEEYIVVPVSELLNPDDELLEKADKLVGLAHISVSDGVSYNPVGDTYSVPVEWGDWKHDHARLDCLLRDVLGLCKISESVTESDGGDAYSSVHKYSLYC